MDNETILYGVLNDDEDWQEVILSTKPENFEQVKTLATKDGYGRFRVATIDLTVKPDFARTINLRKPRKH